MIRTTFFLAIVAFIPDGCTHSDAFVDVNCSGDACEEQSYIDRTVPEYEGQSWHERYVNDACERCPDCCVIVTEDYGD